MRIGLPISARLFLTWLLIVGVGLFCGGCQKNLATGANIFNALDERSEVSLGLQAEPGFIKDYGGEVPAAGVREYVQGLGMKLAAMSERPGLPWKFHVVDSGVINAFALPGGKVFVSRELLSKMTSEAELAGVLGHEIGHVTAQHQGQQMSRAMVLTGVLTGIGIAAERSNKDWLRVLGTGSQVGGTVYMLSFSRDQENQADELGLRYMTKAGYNPVGMLRVMEVLQKEAGKSAGQMEMLSTHPLPQTRIVHVNQLIRERYGDYQDFSRYRFEEEQFKARVLDVLAGLPAAKHQPKRTAGAGDAAEGEEMAGGRWSEEE